MSKNEEQGRGTGGEIEIEGSTGEAVDASNGRLHYKVTSGSRKRCDISSM